MAAAAVLGPVKEGRFILPGNDRRPADIFLPNWADGRDAAIDVTVINPLQQTFLNQSAANPGHALHKAYERKMTRHGEACRRAGITFTPLPLDTFGA